MKRTMNDLRCASTVLGEVRDHTGRWHDGTKSYSDFANMIGTTTADLMRRLKLLGIVEHTGERHRLTKAAIRRCYGTVYQKRRKDQPTLFYDLILPDGMVLIVTNLEATNQTETEVEKLRAAGLSLSEIGNQLGCSKQAVGKRLANLPPRLTDWPIKGSWKDDDDEKTIMRIAA